MTPEQRKIYRATYKNKNPNKYTESHRASARAQRFRNRKRFRKFIDKIKLKFGCKICGYNEHPAALDFDHLKNKKYNIALMAVRVGRTMKRVKEEIRKCQILCANCHRVETQKRRK